MNPRRVDRYEILETLEAAGPVEVHLAQEQESRKRVTLETIAADAFPSRRRSETWLNQVRTLRTFRHPNLLAVLDADRSGCFYVVREWVPGQTLEILLDSGWSFDGLQAAQIGLAVAEGLSYLHQNGRLHGAVCPRNIVLGTEGDIRLGGLGAMLAGRGQEQYMAPEVLTGQAPGRAADLYGLGLILKRIYASCDHWYPTGNQASRLTAMPDPLAALIHTMTVEDPTQRCRSAALVAETLRAMVKRAVPEPEVDPEDGELIDLSPDFLLAIPHYIARPDPRLLPAPTAEPASEPVKRAPRRRRRPLPFWRIAGTGATVAAVGAAALAWPLLGSMKPASAPVQPEVPAAATPAKPAVKPDDTRRKVSGTVKGWAKAWEARGWKLHAAYYQDPVPQFRGAPRSRGDITQFRRREAQQRGLVKVRALSTEVAADGTAQAQVATAWPRAGREEQIILNLKRVRGNWRIVSETSKPVQRPAGPTAKQGPSSGTAHVRSARAL